MKKWYLLAFFFCVTAGVTVAQVNELPRSTPEEQGVPSQSLIALFDSLHFMPQTDIHSMIVMRHGKVVGEFYPKPFAPEYQHTQYSSSKTLVSLAAGIAIDENRLRLSDRVATFFPEYLPDTISTRLAAMTVRHLLTMTSGIKPDWNMRNRTEAWIQTFLSKEVIHEPGEQFAYDSMVTYMIAAIVQKVTGQKLLDYLQEKLFDPMNIHRVHWEESPEGVNTGGWGLHIQSESLAKIGQLWLDGGRWNEKQLISESWIEQISTKQSNGGDFGYGYQTWMCAYPGAVRADGALGQYVIVVPDKDVVIVLTEASFTNGKPQRNLIWNGFLPTLSDEPLPPSKDYQRLVAKQNSYTLEYPEGKKKSSVLKQLVGKTVQLPKNKYQWDRVHFEQADDALLMTITKTDGLQYTQPLGYRTWKTDTIAGFPPYSLNPIGWQDALDGPFYAAGAYGCDKQVLHTNLHYVNWVTSLFLSWKVQDGSIELSISNNYAKNKVETFDCTFVE